MTDKNDRNHHAEGNELTKPSKDQETTHDTEEDDSKLHHPHDTYFKRAMGYHETALVFFKKFLPTEVLAQVDLSTLKPAPTEFTNKLYGKVIQDVLYTVQFHGKAGYLYLHPAHQSSPDPWMAWRMLKAVVDIADFHRRFYKDKYLPLVIPLLYYHGVPTPYPYSLNPFDCFEDPTKAYESIVNPLSTIVDAALQDDGELKQDPWCGSMVLANKHLRDLEPLAMVEPLTRLLKPLEDTPDGRQFLIETLEYYLRSCKFGKPGDIETSKAIIMSVLSESTSGEIMSIMDHLEARGYQQGEDHKAHQIAASMLNKGYPVNDIIEMTGLPLKEIERLKAQTEH